MMQNEVVDFEFLFYFLKQCLGDSISIAEW